MKCPKCEMEMKVTDREGVEIDYCPQCRGVWLDRGELEKIVARTAVAEDHESDFYEDDEYRDERGRGRHGDHEDEEYRDVRGRGRHGDHDDRNYRGRKREGFWGNIMEIFD